MKLTETNYEQQAIDFLTATNTTLTVTYKAYGKYFDVDTEDRDIYTITLERKGRKMTFDFGQSINNSGFYYTKGREVIQLDRSLLGKKDIVAHIKSRDRYFLNNGKSDKIHYPVTPTAYSILACLTKYDPGTLEDFCSNFGYDPDTKTAERIYKAVCKEFDGVERLWSADEIEQLQEIN